METECNAKNETIFFSHILTNDKDTKDIHPAEMNVISFCAMEGSEIIGYAGVVSWLINVKDESFKVSPY